MRLVMMGTGPFAVPTFEALLESGHEVVALVTRPTPTPKGREKQSLNPMRDVAVARQIAVHAPESINTPESVALLTSLAADLLVVCDYGQILKPAALAAARLGGINLHGSLLPKYRGSAPVHWSILAGDATTGVSVIHMTPRLDGGPILAVRETPIGPEETMPELELRLSTMGVAAVLEAIDLLEQWDGTSPIGTPQDATLVTKAPRFARGDGELDYRKSAVLLARQVRAFKPWPGSYTHWLREGQQPLRLIIDRATAEPAETASAAPPGTVVDVAHGKLTVMTADGLLVVTSLQPAGKRVLSAAEFLNGYGLKVGAQLGPAPVVEKL